MSPSRGMEHATFHPFRLGVEQVCHEKEIYRNRAKHKEIGGIPCGEKTPVTARTQATVATIMPIRTWIGT